MHLVIITCLITGLLTAVITRLVGAFLRDVEWQETALPLGLVAAMFSFMAGLALFKSFGVTSSMILLAPVLVIVSLTAVGAVCAGVFFLFVWITRGVDSLALRSRELHNEYNFHRNLDRED